MSDHQVPALTFSVEPTLAVPEMAGVGVVLISHSMPEVLEVADRVHVLRHGRRVAVYQAAETSVEELVGAMTGSLDGKEIA